MKPTLSFSAAFSAPEAPERAPGMIATAASAAAAVAAAAVTTTDDRMLDSDFIDGCCGFPGRGARRAQPETVQRSGTKTSPNDAGAADPARPRPREIKISTTTVARYGKDDMNWEGIGRLIAWA